MADLPLWGSMQKAQDDAETIEEAIQRLVDAHNDATDAHLGGTRSLEAHKAEDVIDHPAGSILSDKATMTEFEIVVPLFNDTMFATGESGSGFYDSGNPPGVAVSIDGDGYAYRSGTLLGFSPWFTWVKSQLFQAAFVVDGSFTWEGYFGIGEHTNGVPDNGAGFHVANGVLKGYYISGSGIQETGALTFAEDALSTARLYYDAATGDIGFFIDGILEDTLTVAESSPEPDPTRVFFGVKPTSTEGGVALWIFDMFYSRQV